MKRFIKEYASYTINEIKNDSMHNAMIKEIALIRIDRILLAKQRELLTVNECMREISRAIDYAIETYNEC